MDKEGTRKVISDNIVVATEVEEFGVSHFSDHEIQYVKAEGLMLGINHQKMGE